MDITINTVQGLKMTLDKDEVVCNVPLERQSTIVNSEPSPEHTSNCHNARLTIGERSNSSRWDSSIDTPEAPCLVEALLTLQSCLNGVQGEEGQIHTHPCRASCLDRQMSLCQMQYTLYNFRKGRHSVPLNNSEKHLSLKAPLCSPLWCKHCLQFVGFSSISASEASKDAGCAIKTVCFT